MHRRITAAATAVSTQAPAPQWVPCPHCWGQRRIWTPVEARNGEGTVLAPTACPACLGLGDVLR